MAQLDAALAEAGLARIMLYGPAKMRKTWWATSAAELGYNVILLDLDYGFHVTRNLSPAARKRIFHFDMRAPVETYRNCAALFLLQLFQSGVAYYDEGARQYVAQTRLDPERTYVRFDLTKLGPRDVVILDSWTAFFTQLVCADRNIIDPAAITKLEWDEYAKFRLALDHFLNNMARLESHFICIGHEDEWAKRKPDAPAKAKPEDAIERIRTQIASVSRSHAATMPKAFTDVLYFMAPNAMQGTQISTKGTMDFDAGSRSLPPSVTKFDDLHFSRFVSAEMTEAVKSNEVFSSPAITVGPGADFLAAGKANASDAQITVGKKPAIIQTLKRS